MSYLTIYSPTSKQNEKIEEIGFPLAPIVQVCVGDHTKQNGMILLTPHLMSDMEIDHYIDELKTELDACRKKAKRELKRQNSNIATQIRREQPEP